jgi:hypothetical protein
MDKKKLEEIVEELLEYKRLNEEKERLAKWIQARCIALGMMMAGVMHQVASWAIDHYVQLKAAFIAFFQAGKGL